MCTLNKHARVFFLVSISSTVFSQTAPPVIEIDFMKLQDKPAYKYVKHGTTYQVRIKNLNRSLYKVEGAVAGKDFNTEMPAIFETVALPGYLNIAPPQTPKMKLTKEEVNIYGGGNSFEETTKQIKTIQASIGKINNCVALNNEFINLFADCHQPYTEIEKELMATVNTYLSDTCTDRKKQGEALKGKLKVILDEAFVSKENLDSLLPVNLSILNFQKKVQDSIVRDWERSLESKKPVPDKEKLRKADEAKSKSDELKAYSDSLKAVVTKCGEYVTSLQKFKDENKIQGLLNNYNMINEANFSYYSEEIKVKKDEVEFDIKISTDKQLPCNRNTKVILLETYQTVGGWKTDFSTGVFVNTGNHDFIGRELYYQKESDSTVSIRAKDGGKRAILGIGALMHVYYRCKNNVNVGLAFGLSTTTAFNALSFHAGGSLLFGKEDRFVVSGGITLREATILDRQYDYNTVYAKADMPEAPPTVKMFPQYGCFVSLTYNWARLKK